MEQGVRDKDNESEVNEENEVNEEMNIHTDDSSGAEISPPAPTGYFEAKKDSSGNWKLTPAPDGISAEDPDNNIFNAEHAAKKICESTGECILEYEKIPNQDAMNFFMWQFKHNRNDMFSILQIEDCADVETMENCHAKHLLLKNNSALNKVNAVGAEHVTLAGSDNISDLTVSPNAQITFGDSQKIPKKLDFTGCKASITLSFASPANIPGDWTIVPPQNGVKIKICGDNAEQVFNKIPDSMKGHFQTAETPVSRSRQGQGDGPGPRPENS